MIEFCHCVRYFINAYSGFQQIKSEKNIELTTTCEIPVSDTKVLPKSNALSVWLVTSEILSLGITSVEWLFGLEIDWTDRSTPRLHEFSATKLVSAGMDFWLLIIGDIQRLLLEMQDSWTSSLFEQIMQIQFGVSLRSVGEMPAHCGWKISRNFVHCRVIP